MFFLAQRVQMVSCVKMVENLRGTLDLVVVGVLLDSKARIVKFNLLALSTICIVFMEDLQV